VPPPRHGAERLGLPLELLADDRVDRRRARHFRGRRRTDRNQHPPEGAPLVDPPERVQRLPIRGGPHLLPRKRGAPVRHGRRPRPCCVAALGRRPPSSAPRRRGPFPPHNRPRGPPPCWGSRRRPPWACLWPRPETPPRGDPPATSRGRARPSPSTTTRPSSSS